MILRYLFIISLLSFVISGCKKKSEDKEAPKVTQIDGLGTLYEAIPEQSIIYWVGSSAGGSHNGSLKIKKSNLEINPHGQLLKGSFIIDMNSLTNLDITDAGEKKDLEDHLKDADFFATDSYPEADFIVTNIAPIIDSITNQFVKGDLNIKGISNPIEFKAQILATGNSALITVPEFTIDRTRWNINYKSSKILDIIKDELISDDIKISMKIVAAKKNVY
ncbi:MAG: YceI family protein [Saprospiraceae bacterium]|nr:YceI family protein [Saprospiraceae bacterium]